MSEWEREEFFAWYETHTSDLFDIRLILDAYSQNDVTVLGLACRVISREF